MLNYLQVSDCNMQEGSLRVDANVNLHIDTPAGIVATPIVEVKNMNSFRAVERALAYEAERQYAAWRETGLTMGQRPKTTRGWDEASQTTRPQRSKEESSDYRYFPDPDLVPVTTVAEEIEAIRASLGELPAAIRERLEQTYGITPYDSDVLVNQGRELVDYYVELARLCGDGKTASNWVQQDVLRTLNERQIGIAEFPLRPAALAEVIAMVRSGQLDTNRGREVLADMIAAGRSLQESMQAMGIAGRGRFRTRRPLPPTAGRQPEDRRRSQGRQAQGRRATDRPGEEEEPQHQSQPGPRTVPELDRKNVSIITLTTDFGTGSPYVAAMKGVILSINPAATLVDITHAVPPRTSATRPWCWRRSPTAFPPGTIHVAVVDPGVGTDREIVYVRVGRQQYIAPDNGLLSRVIAKMPPSKIIRLAEPRFWLADISATFHGRDIMAPVAARLSLGLEPDQLGPPLERLIVLEWPRAQLMERKIAGHVVEIDSFGNLITNIFAEMFAGRPTDARVCVVCNIYETCGVYFTYAEQPQGTLVALVGSSGRLELAIVGDNAAHRLGVVVGTPVVMAWE